MLRERAGQAFSRLIVQFVIHTLSFTTAEDYRIFPTFVFHCAQVGQITK